MQIILLWAFNNNIYVLLTLKEYMNGLYGSKQTFAFNLLMVKRLG